MKILHLLLIVPFSGFLAQTVTPAVGEYLGTVDPTIHKEKWNVNVQNMEMPAPGSDSEKGYLLQLKEEVANKYPRTFSKSNFNKSSQEKGLGSNVFHSINGFEGNLYNNRVPNDNSIAISNAGILMSCINSKYLIYDTEADTLMDEGFLNDYISQFNLTQSKYDPKMTYDPLADRFILTFLIGTYYQNSKIAVCFSTTNNPVDPWNVYLLDGNAIGSDHWTDYPAVAVNENEFFLTGNLLQNSTSWQTGFYQSLIWQIDKWGGYQGDSTLTIQIWSDIQDDTLNIRNIHPVKGARNVDSGTQYFLSNKNFASESDTVYLISIDNTMSSGVAQLEVKQLSTPDHYFMAPNAQQSTAKELATNDSRMLGAVTDGDWIQYVHNTLDTATGTCSVYHGTIRGIDTQSPVASGIIISDSVMDIGYPNIASSAEFFGEEEVVIGFNYTSPVDTNGVACVYMDNANEYSDIIKLNTGERPINILSSSPDRWGDYFGIQRKFDEPCEVWLAGMYGKINQNGCWISEVRTKASCSNNFAGTKNNSKLESNLYPNPVNNVASLDIELGSKTFATISIYSVDGNLIDVIFEDELKSGTNRVTFYTDHLSAGIYLLQINNQSQLLDTKKFVVE